MDWLAGASMMIRRGSAAGRGALRRDLLPLLRGDGSLPAGAARGVVHLVRGREPRRAPWARLDGAQGPVSPHAALLVRQATATTSSRTTAARTLWAANACSTAGLATFKVGARIQEKADPDPARYLRDFVRYNFLVNPP
ncbi:MAG: hypothetical protein M5U28_12590 [Sandaracinaceae bacterium]|nr:hypothetical protein [Sandaracinaceae bacterium]